MTHAIVIGGGIAGCSTAYALAKRNIAVTLIERHAALAQEASGNPLAMLYPKFSVATSLSGELTLQGYLFTLQCLRALAQTASFFNPCGLLQLASDATEQHKQYQLLQQTKLQPYLHALDKRAASDTAGIDLEYGGLYLPDSGYLKPALFCAALADSALIRTLTAHQVLNITPRVDGWQVSLDEAKTLDAEIVVLCNANAIKQFKPCQHAAITPVRGQINYFQASAQSRMMQPIICTDHYLSPAVDGWHTIGTTFHPNDANTQLSAADTRQNIDALRAINTSMYQAISHMDALPGRVAWRSATSDYLPLAGLLLDEEKLLQTPPRYNANPADLPWLRGLYVNAGHGSKGMITAPICGELIASLVTQSASVLPDTLISRLNPSRFTLRKLGLKQLAQTLYSSRKSG